MVLTDITISTNTKSVLLVFCVMNAKELDFAEFAPDMLQFLDVYRTGEKSKKDAKAAAVAARKGGEVEEDDDDHENTKPAASDEEDEDDDDNNDHPAAGSASPDKKHERTVDGLESVEASAVKRAKTASSPSSPIGEEENE